MTYLCAVAGAIGLFVIITGGYKVMPEPICPNCRRPLESFEVERCPYCLLWMPPGLDRPRQRWRPLHVTVGACLIVMSACVFSMSRAGIFERLAATKTTTAPATAPAMTPAQIRLQALGYSTTSAPANLPAPSAGSPIITGTSSGNSSPSPNVP